MAHRHLFRRLASQSYAGLLAPLALIAILLTLYSYSLLPGLGYSGDTAKFQFLGKILGTPHPTGYPTYVLLNHLFVETFPLGTVAFRANLLSALFAVGAVLFVWLMLRLLQRSVLASFLGALLFGLTRTFWSQAVVAEVYTLNALFVAAVVYFFLRWHLHRQPRAFYLACLLYALSFGNHLTMITLLPAIVYLVWVTDRQSFFTPRRLAIVALFILLGAAQYLYIVVRSLAPDAVYLETRATSLYGLLAIVSGGVYQNQMFTFSLRELLFARLLFFLKSLVLNYHLFSLLALPGFLRLRPRPLNRFLLLAILGNLFFSLNYAIADIVYYFIPIYLLLAVYVGFGLDWLQTWFVRHVRGQGAQGAAVVLLFVLLLFLGVTNLRAAGQNHNRHVPQTVHLLTSFPPGESVLLADYAYRQYLLYATFVEEANFDRFYVVEAFPWGYPDPPTLGALRAYLESGERGEIMDVAPGRPVYCAGSSCPDLADAGVALEPVDGDLYAVTGFQ